MPTWLARRMSAVVPRCSGHAPSLSISTVASARPLGVSDSLVILPMGRVATGYAAEIGSMRIGEEIDALDVMGVESITFLCATRVMAVWLVLPFLYAGAVAVGFMGSYLAVVAQVAQTTGSAYLAIFWQFQSPPDMLFSLAKAMAMATFVTIVGCYYGYTASGGPIGVGKASARSMAVNIIGIHAIGIVGTQLFWGNNPRSPVGG